MKVATADVNAMPGTSVRPSSRSGILLDRDGTIIVDHGYVGSVARVDFIDGAAEAIATFNHAGIPVAVVTNQAGVARGLYGIDDVVRVHQYIAENLAGHGAHVDLFLFCPYHPTGVVEAFARTSEDRKPRPGMAKAAEAALGLDHLKISDSRKRSEHRRSTWGATNASALASGRSRAWRQPPRSSWSVSRYEFCLRSAACHGTRGQ